MFNQILCKPHFEPIRYVALDSNNQRTGFCMICATQAKGQLELIEDYEKTIEQKKNFLNKIVEQQKSQNEQTLNSLLENLMKFKEEQIKIFNDLIQTAQIEIQNQSKMKKNIIEQIQKFSSFNLIDLVQLFENLILDKIEDQIKEQILRSIKKLDNQNFARSILKTLSQFPSKKYLEYNYASYGKLNLGIAIQCQKHREDVVAVDLLCNIYPDQLKCIQCISEKPTQVMMIKQANAFWNEHHEKLAFFSKQFQVSIEESREMINQRISQNLERKKEKLEKSMMTFNSILNKKQQFISGKINQNIKNRELNCSLRPDISELIFIQSRQKQFRDSFIDNLKRLQMKDTIESKVSFKNLFQSISELEKLIINFDKDINQIRNSFKIDYKILEESSIKQQETCYAIAINFKTDLFAVGCGNKINIFEFNFSLLKPLQLLDEHQDNVNCLEFLSHSNNLVSASNDKTIKIWTQQKDKFWSLTQTLLGHTHQIVCLVTNCKGDLIISGSCDKTIRFWKANYDNFSDSQIISEHQHYVNSLSLNESERKLISCGNDDHILVMEMNHEEWQIIQKINTAYGFRLCFITDNKFSFQPKQNFHLQIYEFNVEQKQFLKIKEIEMKENQRIKGDNFLFPQYFIQSKQLLFNKFKNRIHIIRKFNSENNEFFIENQIEFKDQFHYGTVSIDGQFLVTWNYGQKEIQVRQYKEITTQLCCQ